MKIPLFIIAVLCDAVADVSHSVKIGIAKLMASLRSRFAGPVRHNLSVEQGTGVSSVCWRGGCETTRSHTFHVTLVGPERKGFGVMVVWRSFCCCCVFPLLFSYARADNPSYGDVLEQYRSYTAKVNAASLTSKTTWREMGKNENYGFQKKIKVDFMNHKVWQDNRVLDTGREVYDETIFTLESCLSVSSYSDGVEKNIGVIGYKNVNHELWGKMLGLQSLTLPFGNGIYTSFLNLLSTVRFANF